MGVKSLFYTFYILVLCFLSFFGILYLYKKFLLYIYDEKIYLSSPCYIVFTTKNQQDTIEISLRKIIFHMELSPCICDICVVDLGSTDDTVSIIKNFEKTYDFLHVYSLEEYMDKLKMS